MPIVDTLNRLIRDVPDFPKPGIIYKDITPVLEDGPALREVVAAMVAPWREAGLTRLIGVESRGFIFGAAMAYELGIGLVLVRKPGKLPRETHQVEYELEYGSDHLEMHTDALGSADRVLIVDDVLATGGTAAAVADMVARTGAHPVGFSFVLELGFLSGRTKLNGARVESLQVL